MIHRLARLAALGLFAIAAIAADPPAQPWPPIVDQAYPDLALSALDGTPFSLKSLAGKPLLIEYVGIPCAGCQAFLGGNREGVGGFGGVQPQANLQAVAEYLPRFGKGLALDDPRFTYVVILFYGTFTRAPTAAEARDFAAHFALAKPNHVVLVGDQRYIQPATYAMIPGFQVVDADFVLRSDAAGHAPTHSLWEHAFPTLARLVAQRP